MSDVEERIADRASAAEGSLKTWIQSQRLQCRKGDHCWSDWIENRAGTEAWGDVLSPDNHQAHTRECLICPARQRMLRRLGKRTRIAPGVSSQGTLEEEVLDL